MRALVVDTNVLVSAALQDGVPRKVLRLVRRRYELAFTRATFAELRTVLSRAEFGVRISDRDRRQFLSSIRALSSFYRVENTLPIARDPDDDVYLHLAVAVDAAAIVTGDRDLLVLVAFAGIPILSPSGFLRSERSIRRGRRERGD